MTAKALANIASTGGEDTWNRAVPAYHLGERGRASRRKKVRTKVCTCLVVGNILDVLPRCCTIDEGEEGKSKGMLSIASLGSWSRPTRSIRMDSWCVSLGKPIIALVAGVCS